MDKIFETTFGSRLYGTDVPESDYDVKGVYVPRAEDILMQRASSVVQRKDTLGGAKRESELLPLIAFLRGLALAETNCIDMLFSPPESWTMEPHFVWHEVFRLRRRLIRRDCRAMVGYCKHHVAKYGVRTLRMDAARAAVELFSSLPQDDSVGQHGAALEAVAMKWWEVRDIVQSSGRPVRHLSVCERMVQYTGTVRGALAVYQKLLGEYGHRTAAAGGKMGIDWKGVMHAVRVAGQAVELLETGHVTFPRPDRARLLAIRLGDVDLDEIGDSLDETFARVERLSATSTQLSAEPDAGLAEALAMDAYGKAVALMKPPTHAAHMDITA